MTSNQETRAAMKWWRAQNPQFTDAKVVKHGWHGRCVMATVHYETQVVASITDVKRAYRAAHNLPQPY